jgi:hypothetical protein
MHSRKVAAARPPANRFSVFAESDSDEEDAVVVPVIEVAEQPVAVAPAQALVDNRFEGLVKPAPLVFTQQKGRWSRQRVDPEENWIRLHPSPEHEQAAIAAAGIDQSVVVAGREDPVRDVPRTAHDWAEKVKQSLEKAESAPRVERLKDIHESLNRLSFFRKSLNTSVAPMPT